MLRMVVVLSVILAAAACSTIDETRFPLGTSENPVRADMPGGQRAYLDRLRCANGKAPTYFRFGNLGDGPYRNIIDGYSVECEGSEPASTTIVLDMYHRGYVERRAVPGFTIVAP